VVVFRRTRVAVSFHVEKKKKKKNSQSFLTDALARTVLSQNVLVHHSSCVKCILLPRIHYIPLPQAAFASTPKSQKKAKKKAKKKKKNKKKNQTIKKINV
jgi:hypothetical protein